MAQMKPASAPPCWSLKYQDGDPECTQCPHRDTCRPALLERVTAQPMRPPQMIVPLPQRPFLPVLQQQQGPQLPMPLPPQQQAFRPPMQMPVPSPMGPPPVVQYQQQQYPQQYQQQQLQPQPQQYLGGYLPDPNNPNPLAPMMRPGAPQPAYYFTQYPGESTMQRLGKNMALRGAESVFGELMFFFRHWTWPPNS